MKRSSVMMIMGLLFSVPGCSIIFILRSTSTYQQWSTVKVDIADAVVDADTVASASAWEEVVLPCTPVPRDRIKNPGGVIMYTRVPKTAGSTVQNMIRTMGLANKFPTESSPEHNELFLETLEQRKQFASSLMGKKTHTVFDRHLYYLNHTELGFNTKPLYISLVREPVARAVSNYYYALKRGFITGPATFDECVHEALVAGTKTAEHCRITWGGQLRFFCGHDPVCREEGRPALELAKRNLREAYVTVGYTENLEGWMKVLSDRLSRWFKRAPTVTKMAKNEKVASPYPHPSPEVAAAVAKQLWAEIEFYEYARAVFDAQLQDC